MQRNTISSSTNVPLRKRLRVLAADIQWCVNNKDTITLKSFAENFGLLEKQYAVSRYTSIINSRHLAVEQKRLRSELNLFKKSEDFKLYWKERMQKRTQLDLANETKYVHDAAEGGTRTLASFSTAADAVISTSTTSTPSVSYLTTTISTTNDTTKTTEDESTVDTSAADTVVPTTIIIIEDAENQAPLIPWIFKGVNVAELFTKFQQAVQRISTNRLFFIESSVNELLALSNIFLLCRGQHSPLCINIFTEDILSDLNKDY